MPAQFRKVGGIQSAERFPVQIKLDLPEDLFDAQFTEPDFAARVRELAILELVRVKRMHEHEAQRMLGIERHELVARMEAAGIVPTEKVFEEIKGELGKAIAGRNARRRPS
jgi:DNA-binding NtrC family response regulator